jgi:hypothetical protein
VNLLPGGLLLLLGIAAAPAQPSLATESDPASLQALAVAAAADPRQTAALAQHLADPAFLARLDPPVAGSTPVVRLGTIFDTLRAHPSPAAESLCLRLLPTPAFQSVPARKNGLLAALAARRPMSAPAAAALGHAARNGFLETIAPLLARNRSPSALALLESLLADDTLNTPLRIAAAHAALVPNRHEPQLLQLAGRLLRRKTLPAPVALAVAESLFLYLPREWPGVPAPQGTPGPQVARLRKEIGAELRRWPGLPPGLLAALPEN